MKEWIVKDTLNNKYVQELVRCKDCKHGEPCNEGDVFCTKDIGTFKSPVHKPWWFCAEGSLKKT